MPRPVKMNDGICGFCFVQTETAHQMCRRSTRNGNGSVVFCKCDHPFHAPHQAGTPRCSECYNITEGEVDKKTWLCVEADECNARVHERIKNDSTIQMIEAVRAKARESQAADGHARAARRASSGEGRPTSGVCLCCGEATGGGKFRPGHDARLVSRVAQEVADGKVTPTDALEKFAELGVSDALQAKLKRKIERDA